MKKIITTTKAMLLAAVVFIVAQGCNLNESVGENPTSNLTGKIKGSIWSSDLITINFYFNYNTDGKLISWKEVAPSLYNLEYTIEYQTNKVIVKDSTNLPVYVYYLKSNTNLIDSFDIFGQTPGHTIIERDALNNIVKIGNNQYGFIYENNNLKSFWDAGFWTPMSGYNYEYTYDYSKMSKANTNPYGAFGSTSVNVDFLGLSMGNTSEYAISSISANVDFSFSTVNFNYTNYTPTNVSIDITGSLSNSFIKWNSVNNTYY